MSTDEPAKFVSPSQVTQLRATKLAPTAVTLAWKAPTAGTLPIRYTVFYRVMGVNTWSIGGLTSDLFAVVTALRPATEYEFEILAHNT
jgi:hypothetical protein